MSEINKSKVMLEMVECKTKKAEISVEEIFDIIFEELYGILDNTAIYSEQPCLDYSDNGDNVEVYMSGLDDTYPVSDIIEETRQKADKALEAFINDYINEKKSAVKKEETESGEVTL